MRKNIILKLCSLALVAAASLLNYKTTILAQTPSQNLLFDSKIKRIKISGSTMFGSEDFKPIIEPLIGKQASFEEVLQLRTTVTNLYTEKGFTTSGAFIPAQGDTDGVLYIQVIEGKLEETEITGLEELSKNYVESRIKLAADEPLNVSNLEQAIQLLEQNTLIDSVNAQLVSGSGPGLSVLKLDVVEASNINTRFVVANDESPNVGEYRATAALDYQNLLGVGDLFSAEYGLTSGLDRFSFGYSLPINARDGSLFISYGDNSSQLTNSFFSFVDIDSESQSINLGLRQPIIKDAQNELALSLALDLRDSETFVNDDSISLDPDRPGESGESNVTAIRLAQEWFSRSNRNIFGASSQFSVGIDAFDATIDDTGTDGRFFSWLGQFQWLKALNKERDALLITRLASQFTPDSLLSLEQFALGGQGSVRGYEQNLRIGDNGFLSSVELRIPLTGDPDKIGLVQLAPFVDAGTIWGDEGIDNPFLASLGLGVNWELKETLSLQAYYGVSLVDVEDERDSLQSDGVTFSLQVVPFQF